MIQLYTHTYFFNNEVLRRTSYLRTMSDDVNNMTSRAHSFKSATSEILNTLNYGMQLSMQYVLSDLVVR